MQTPIAPPPPGTQATPAQSPAPTQSNVLPSGTGSAPSLPPSLANALNAGGSLNAQVIGQAGGQGATQGSGQTLLLSVSSAPSNASQAGQTTQLQVQTALSLPPGTSVAISLQSSGPPASLLLQPNASGVTQNAAGQSGTAQASLIQSNPTQSNPGQSLASQAGAARPAVVTSLTQGSVFTATVTSTTATAGHSAAAGLSNAPSSPNAGGATSNAAVLATKPAPALPAGSTMQVQLQSWAPPTQMTGQGLGQFSAASSGSNGFLATVTGSTAAGTNVQTSTGTLSLNLTNTPPTGSQLLLSMIGQPNLAGPESAQGSVQRFQALQDAVALLRSGDPAAAQRLTQGLLPQPNAQLGLAAAFLIGAMRQGGVDRWLGRDTTRAIEALGGKDSAVLGSLKEDLSKPPGRATDASGQEWRVTQLPILGEDQIEQIRLYTRPPQEDRENDGETQTQGRRFVIEATFSRLGPIQLEGFSRDKQIDMVVRSQTPIEAFARDEIRALFADTISALGFAGVARFQVVPAFDLVPDRTDTAPAGWTV